MAGFQVTLRGRIWVTAEVDFSPDGKILAVGYAIGGVFLMQMDAPRSTYFHIFQPILFLKMPNNTQIDVTTPTGLFIYDIEGHLKTKFLVPAPAPPSNLNVAPQ
jgi:hypothetical protein